MHLGALTRRPPTERHRLLRDKQSFRCHQLGHRARERTPSATVRPTTSSTQEQPRDQLANLITQLWQRSAPAEPRQYRQPRPRLPKSKGHPCRLERTGSGRGDPWAATPRPQHIKDYHSLCHIMDPKTLETTPSQRPRHRRDHAIAETTPSQRPHHRRDHPGTEHLADQNPRTWTPITDHNGPNETQGQHHCREHHLGTAHLAEQIQGPGHPAQIPSETPRTLQTRAHWLRHG